MEFAKIKETCLYVKDLRQTREFYADLLGLPVISEVPGRHVFFRAGASVLLCFNADVTSKDEVLPPHYGEGKMHLAFEANAGEYQAWKQQLSEKGIAITHEQDWGDNYHSFYFEDPDGHCLEIVQPGMWER